MMGLDLSEPEEIIVVARDNFWADINAFVDSILENKKDIYDAGKYTKARFYLLKTLAYYADVIPYVNEVNRLQMEPQMEYEFLLKAVPSRSRGGYRWIKKPVASLYMKSVQEYYDYNVRKAEEAMKILTVEQLTKIDKKIKREDECQSSGGTASKSR